MGGVGERRRGYYPAEGKGEVEAVELGEGVVDESCGGGGWIARGGVVQAETGLINLLK